MNGQVFQIARAIATDSYKLGRMIQYPEGTELVYSNLTSRTNKYSPIPKHLDDGVFGVQGVIQNMID